MLLQDVANLPPEERLLYWIRERHSIYLKRQRGEPKPWTDDSVLQNFFFTNPYRENDKTTVWFREKVREPLRNSPFVFFATVCFRWFNYIPTGELLERRNLLIEWNGTRAIRFLSPLDKVFTGAFMIPAPPKTTKVEHVCRCLDYVWQRRDDLTSTIKGCTLQEAHSHIRLVPWLGNFMSYEIVTDLRHTYLLEDATDKMTWANPGPGAIRGLRRLAGLPLSAKGNSDCLPKPKDWQQRMQRLLALVNERLHLGEGMPHFEMREIEHSLCEWDKAERARLGDGKMKRRFRGVR